MKPTTTRHKIVPHDEWIAARTALLRDEKEFTRSREQLAEQRRALPWERVANGYIFEGPDGATSLLALFDGLRQLIVYHFMFAPNDVAGCPHCSFWADNFDKIPVHLRARDVSFVAVSRARYAKLAAYKQRMGWDFPWFSSSENDFNFDYDASFSADDLASHTAFYNYTTEGRQPAGSEVVGVSVFFREDEQVFHTYSTFARGVDMVNGAYHYLDLTPKGRDEHGYDNPQFWVRRHDEY